MPARTGYYAQPMGSPAAFPYATNASPYSSPTYTASPMPLSPPPMNHTRSLYACTPLPALNGTIHPALDAHIGHLTFNVLHDPASAFTVSSSYSPRVLAEAATNPALPYIAVISDRFPWPIAVYASSQKPGAAVTVADVLYAIHRELQQHVSANDLESAPPAVVDAARRAYIARCQNSHNPAAAQALGLKRIDFLLGKHTFGGLVPTKESPDVWLLKVS